ncbi:hypothetical protein PG987_000428 [Apiospora arundinis]
MRFPAGYAVALLLSPVASASQKVLADKHDENPLDDAFERLALKTLDEFHVPGLAIAIVDGENTWAAGYGNATLPGTPVTPSTLFYGGSTTKAFTAAAFAQLISDSDAHPDLTWRTPLSSLIRDDFVLEPAYEWAQEHLTLEDALSHRTGFPRHDKSLSTAYGPDGHKATMRDITQSLRHLPMVHEPRVEFRYCNLMFMVASHVLQTLTGRWLGTTLREGIWKPLGMNATYFSLEDAQAAPEHLAMGYWWDYGSSSSPESKTKGGYGEVPFAGLDEASGAGAVVSNVLDYAKWIRCLANEAEPLSKAAHTAIKTPRITPMGNSKGWDGPGSYALGWMMNPYKGHTVYNHGGGMEGYGAEVFFMPDLGYGVVTLANTARTSNYAGKTLAWKLINDKLGVAEEDRYDWAAAGKKAIHDVFSGYDSAVERLYPDRAEPSLPPALPLQKYAGTYYHPAYQNLTVEVVDNDDSPLGPRQSSKTQLKASRANAVWDMSYDFEHVSGEFWAVFIDLKKSPNWLSGEVAKAEFRLGSDGWPDELVVEYMEDGNEGVITYERVD